MGTALRQSILDRVVPASRLSVAPHAALDWSLENLCGRLVELSARSEAAHLTAAFGLVLDAQLHGDRAAWITLEDSSFFPPDVADGGVDLNVLPVVRVADVRIAGRAADHLVRSGGFGLVVLDFSSELEAGAEPTQHKLPVPLLTRLLGLARRQNVAVLMLTKKAREESSLHSLISLRAEAQWQRRETRFEVSVRVLKDKRGSREWTHREMCRGPAGLR